MTITVTITATVRLNTNPAAVSPAIKKISDDLEGVLVFVAMRVGISGDLKGVLVCCVGGESGSEAGGMAGDSSCTVGLVEHIINLRTSKLEHLVIV